MDDITSGVWEAQRRWCCTLPDSGAQGIMVRFHVFLVFWIKVHHCFPNSTSCYLVNCKAQSDSALFKHFYTDIWQFSWLQNASHAGHTQDREHGFTSNRETYSTYILFFHYFSLNIKHQYSEQRLCKYALNPELEAQNYTFKATVIIHWNVLLYNIFTKETSIETLSPMQNYNYRTTTLTCEIINSIKLRLSFT